MAALTLGGGWPPCRLRRQTSPTSRTTGSTTFGRGTRHRSRPNGGDSTAPDIDRARELVRRSGTQGMRVDMITVRGDALFSSAAEVVADALRRLGYRVSLRMYPDFGTYFGAYSTLAGSVEVAFNGWIQDYPAASNFIRGVFECNPYFCDRAFERRSRRVVALPASEPRGRA